MKKVLVVGSGGREHALVWKLSHSPDIGKLYCAPGNGGIEALAECVPIKATDTDGMVAFARENAVDFVVVAPDDPLALGMVDALEQNGIAAFGPTKAAAEIEGSKIFSKNLMKKYGIPTARFEVFTEQAAALSYVRAQGAPIVIKADGLALGKGVVVAETLEAAEAAIDDMMNARRFGDAGGRLVIEERMEGPEVTVLAFCDGRTVRPMPASQDHKRIFDGDRGPNTGGMGAVSPPVCYTSAVAERCMREIFLPTLRAMDAEGKPFKGVLYFGLMLTADGPKVIEYNARFGDPEAQAVLMLLESDLFSIMRAVREERLAQEEIKWKDAASCCLVLASGGYPGEYRKGLPISGLDSVNAPDVFVFHAGTRRENGAVLTAGGRVLGVTALGITLREAIDAAYLAAEKIHFEGMCLRHDIGAKNLV